MSSQRLPAIGLLLVIQMVLSMSVHRFVAPSTLPTMLYRFEKKVSQSSRTPFSLSDNVDQSGETSSAFVELKPKAREASWPANTVFGNTRSALVLHILPSNRVSR